jgi:hypothetical protein
MMLRRWLCLLALLLCAGPAAAQETSAQEVGAPWRINNIPLDIPLEGELGGEYLEGIYQEKLMDRLQSSVLNEWPSYHIHSTLKIDRSKLAKSNPATEEAMDLYFSSATDAHRLFWIRTHKPMSAPADAAGIAAVIAMIENNFAKVDRVITDAAMPGNAILLIVDAHLPPDEQARMLAGLPEPFILSHDDFTEFWAMDLQSRARVLGRDFRGAIVLLNSYNGQLQSMQTELLDLKRAQLVFVLP